VESELSFRHVLSLLRLHKLIVVKVQMPTKHDIKMTARSKFLHQIDIVTSDFHLLPNLCDMILTSMFDVILMLN